MTKLQRSSILSAEARTMLEPTCRRACWRFPVTIVVRKAIRRLKRTLGLTNLQLRGEHELENMAGADPSILGRIDITLQFLHQFGDEDAYVGVECKRVRAGDASLNGSYVSKGVDRFATGQYAAGHEWGFMLGVCSVAAGGKHRRLYRCPAQRKSTAKIRRSLHKLRTPTRWLYWMGLCNKEVITQSVSSISS